MHPTLIVGVGGAGTLAVRALKHKYDQTLRPNERVDADFLAIDLDMGALQPVDGLAELGYGDFCYLNPTTIRDLLKNLDRRDERDRFVWREILKWFPEPRDVPIPVADIEQNGAGQYRLLGRLGLFQNDLTIESILRRKIAALPPGVDRHSLTEGKRVVLVCSVAGGTGAGMLVDLAYLARRQAGNPRVDAYLLLPDLFFDLDKGGRIRQNGYGCLRELAHLKDQQIAFNAEYYNIAPVAVPPGGEQPFSRIYLFRHDPAPSAQGLVGACSQLADSVLGQLQKEIQNLSLSVENNVPTAESKEDQRRLRTHCFSAVSSSRLKTRAVKSDPARFRDAILWAIRDPDFRQRLVEDDAKRGLEAIDAAVRQHLIAQSDEDGTPPASRPRRDISESAERTANGLARMLEEHAAQNAASVIKALQEKVTNIHARSATDVGSDALLSDLHKIEDIVSAQHTEDNYADQIKRLLEFNVFSDEDKELKRLMANVYKQFELLAHANGGLSHQAVLDALKAKQGLLFAPFPSPPDEHPKAAELRELRTRAVKTSRRLWGLLRRLFADPSRRFSRTEEIITGVGAVNAILADAKFARNLTKTFRARAARSLMDRIRRTAEQPTRIQNLAQAWVAQSELAKDRPAGQAPETMRIDILPFIRAELAGIVQEFEAQASDRETTDEQSGLLLKLIVDRLRKYPELTRDTYVLDETSGDELEDSIYRELVTARPKAFTARSPNSLHRTVTFVMIPTGLRSRRQDSDTIRTFIREAANQILRTQSQVATYQGDHIWIYHESLYNPPDHIAGIDEYYRQYERQSYKELFHIDKRFLSDPGFTHIWFPSRMQFVGCGNAGCHGDISREPRTTVVCPYCLRIIRSRCGNIGCTKTDLHQHQARLAKTCPSCRGYNHSAWWSCAKHGNVAVDIPIDKERCPSCLVEHHADPAAWPSTRISVRPDVGLRKKCPSCEKEETLNPAHESFLIPPDLFEFYQNGVNGHNKELFEALARQYGLPDLYRCPRCRAQLIPVDLEEHSAILRDEESGV